MAHAKSSDPATPPKKKFGTCTISKFHICSELQVYQYLKEIYKSFTSYKVINILPYVKEVYLIFYKLQICQYFTIRERSILILYKLQYSKQVYQVQQYF